MFQLTNQELIDLRCQIGISSSVTHRGRRTTPYAFTQEGVAMLSSVLSGDRAIQVNILIMRVFVNLRDLVISHKDLSGKLELLETKYDQQFQVVFDAIREMMSERSVEPPRILGLEQEKSSEKSS